MKKGLASHQLPKKGEEMMDVSGRLLENMIDFNLRMEAAFEAIDKKKIYKYVLCQLLASTEEAEEKEDQNGKRTYRT